MPALFNRSVLFATLGSVAAAAAILLGAGFTVDDALISTRMAHHLANGVGYRFNPGGPMVDAVTPLGWAHLLAPVSGSSVWAGLQAARWIGVLAALLTGALLGVRIARHAEQSRSLWALVPLAVSLPFGAWSQAGMETPLVSLLVGLSLFESRAAWVFASAAAAWRPELLPWALVWAALSPALSPKQRLLRLLLVLSLPTGVAFTRFALFEQLAPLSVFAKPADAHLGFSYVLSGFLLIGLPLAQLRLPGEPRLHGRAIALNVALLVELLGLALAGGDWMALFRLFVPLLPAWVWLMALRLACSTKRRVAARTVLATGLASLLLFTHGTSSRSVLEHRRQAIAQLATMLENTQGVGTLDVGWVGAATPGRVVDFAGVTDLEVALLPGSHTSKRLPADFIRRKQLQHLVLLLKPGVTNKQIQSQSWTALPFARVVEQRIARMEEAPQFSVIGDIEFGGQHRYLVLEREPPEAFAEAIGRWNRTPRPLESQSISRKGFRLGT